MLSAIGVLLHPFPLLEPFQLPLTIKCVLIAEFAEQDPLIRLMARALAAVCIMYMYIPSCMHACAR